MTEKPGFFYLGREYSIKQRKLLDSELLYDSRDLTTHAVCVGMTGSGKTGLCIDLIEEATLNSIPSVIIDPKGDMTNLLLAFPDLLPDDFLPWINPEDAKRNQMGLKAYSEEVSHIWEKGLSKWGIGKERIRRYKESAVFSVYTPGSKSGNSVSILSSLNVPALSWEDEEETLREKVRGTVSALLGLIDYNTDPIRSKEHVLISNIFEFFWRKGEGLTLEKLIGAISNPPFEKLGVLSIETFIPKSEREKLILALNSLIAAPSFTDWVEGEPLDIYNFLWSKDGIPKVSIFYLAHLSDNEKIFFISLLLEEFLTWVRSQPGTNMLKNLFYIDEVFGYLPPYPLNPSTKKPLLLLLKQARAFGTGMMLTTQNPVDLDYKALTNAGTWFIGKLQAERDKQRLLEGLQTVTSEQGEIFNRKYLDHLISSLTKRVFIQHNVHNEKPTIFKTRWAMSYLRGPLTKEQLKRFKKFQTIVVKKGKGEKKHKEIVKVRPKISRKLEQFFLPPKVSQNFILSKYDVPAEYTKNIYFYFMPMLYAKAHMYIDKEKPSVSFSKEQTYICKCNREEKFFIWKLTNKKIDKNDLSFVPELTEQFGFIEVNPRLSRKEGVDNAKKELLLEMIKNEKPQIYYCRMLKLYSSVGETLDEFEDRCSLEFERLKRQELKKVEKKYAKRIDRVNERIERKKMAKQRYEQEAEARKREELLSGAETALSWIFGRRSIRGLSTASRKRRMSRMSEERAREADTLVKTYQEDIIELKRELEDAVDEIEDKFDDALEEIHPVELKIDKKDIEMKAFFLLWVPCISIEVNGGESIFDLFWGEKIE
ncbi:MAG: hypothetical protein B5M53_08525 [Candidatus Cloacimonas sp. 4484_209]|nr:MAG: hypothetical protein B5M53_08525 [Candidatus Cloacimonas sp. 4484_209]